MGKKRKLYRTNSPGDIIIFDVGDKIPADCLILESKELSVNEDTLTGENYPVEKSTKALNAEIPLAQRTNSLWMGTSVESGSRKALAVVTGKKQSLERYWKI